MKPRRTVLSNCVFELAGGNEDNSLWIHREQLGVQTLNHSCWVPDDDERERIANGANIDLIVWGKGHPPVAMTVTAITLGRP